jgi:glycosyltransferase involved in cell wall biosynthesis
MKTLKGYDPTCGLECETSSEPVLIEINEPYFLSVCVPLKIDRTGTRWCNELWAKDLALHLEYLNDLTLASPRVFAEPLDDDCPLDTKPFHRLKFIDLPSPKNHLEAIASFPELALKMWNGIKPATIVHSGFGGWPISEGWLAIPFGKLQRKFVISYVESSFWRVSNPGAKWHKKLRGLACEKLNKFCVRIADLRFFTSKAYQEEFLGPADSHDRSCVTPATWIDESIILTDEQALKDWSRKSGEVRLLFAGRLVADKGVSILLDAIGEIENEITANITIIGDGPLANECASFAAKSTRSPLKIQLMSPVKYGREFFDLLRGFDAVLIPSISKEQPRLIFDAFSQSIPILGSNTGGIMEVVDDNISGKLFESGDASSLARLLIWACKSRSELQTLGISALKRSRGFTHRSMHEQRSKIISDERLEANFLKPHS